MKFFVFLVVIWRWILMAWTSPKTWASEPLTSTDMNTHIRDNLNYLHSGRPSAQYIRDATNYTTTSTSYVDVDAANMSLTITTTGGDVRVSFAANGFNTGTNQNYVGVRHDGTDYEMMASQAEQGRYQNFSFGYVFEGLSAGSHTFTLRFRTSAGTMTMRAVNIQFDVREV